nr:MAG TPA: hypothetical protein [Caudoviricetes sp.]
MLKAKIEFISPRGDDLKESDELNRILECMQKNGCEIIDVKPYQEIVAEGYNFLIIYKDKSDGL